MYFGFRPILSKDYLNRMMASMYKLDFDNNIEKI